MEYNGVMDAIVPNIVTHAESCSKTATLVALDAVDAILGWRVFSSWHDNIDVVYLQPEQIPRLAYIPGAVTTCAENKESAREFLRLLVSEEGKEILARWGYLSGREAAMEYAPDARIGGEYELPENYTPLAR